MNGDNKINETNRVMQDITNINQPSEGGNNVNMSSMNDTNTNEMKNVQKKPIYKKWWFWMIIVIVVLIGIIALSGSGNNDSNNDENMSNSGSVVDTSKVAVIDFSAMTDDQITAWCNDNGLTCTISTKYSDTVPKGSFVEQSVAPNTEVNATQTVTIYRSLGVEPTSEQKNALKKAQSYSDNMHMSQAGIYKQLTSEYGEAFPADAAQYAIENVSADWNKNALEKAKSYYNNMNMSKQAVYDQLISEYGEGFTPEQAQYAIDNLE